MFPGMGGANPRQLAGMMKKLGIDVEEIEGVEDVLVRTKTHEYRFTKANVSIMRAQGTETWQIVGKPTKVERAGAISNAKSPSSGTAPGVATNMPTPGVATDVTSPAPPVEISEDDVELVMKETGKDAATARKALEESGGDLAEAIVRLS